MILKSVAEQALGAALKRGGDFAELFCEDRRSGAVGLVDGHVENASTVRRHGAGIRVYNGLNSVYVHTNDTSLSGLLAAAGQAAHLAGAMPVIATDLRAERRALALKLGADAAIDPLADDYFDRLRELTGGKRADSVIEVTGNPSALNQAIRSAARYGRVALLGCTRRPVEADFYHDVHYPGLTIYGAHTGVRPCRGPGAGA